MTTQRTISLTFEDARLVAVVNDGGAIIETGPLVYQEGRYPHRTSDDDPNDPPSLQYFSSFERPGAAAPDASVAVEARIVIDGKTELGPTEIRGDGWIGYDDKGNVEGRFNDVPVILIDSVPAAEQQDGPAAMDDEAFREHLRTVQPIPSAQFERAARSRRIGDEG